MKILRQLLLIGAWAGFVVATLLCVQCQEQPAPTSATAEATPMPIAAHYVGTNTCVPCHQEVAASFQHTGKNRAFYTPDPAGIIEDFRAFAVHDPHLDLSYTAFWRADTMWIAEFRLRGRDTVHYRAEAVDYVMGSGRQTRSYVYEENGYFYEMPLTWYVGKGIWDLSPGYEDGQNSRFERPIGDQCMNCHNGGQQFVPQSVNRFTAVGVGIGCEQCHGPGSAHVAHVQAGDTGHPAIVNPARLPLTLQFDVCQQCHLEGVAVPRPGRQVTDFRPGEPLSASFDVFIPVTGRTEDYGFASHAERLQMSACFVASAGQLNCNSCHDPHAALPTNARAVYNQQCADCHAKAAPVCGEGHSLGTGDCVACHMPKQGPSDIPHVSTSDHYIRVHRATPAPAASEESALTFRNFTDTVASGRALALAYIQYFETIEADPRHLKAAAPHAGALAPAEQLKWAYLRGEPLPATWQAHTPGEVADAYVAFYLAELHHRAGRPALAWYERAVALAPDHLDFRYYLAQRYDDAAQYAAAAGHYEELLRRRPSHAKALVNLGFLHLRDGRYDTALRLTEQAVAAHPDYRLALENRLNLRVQREEWALARQEVADLRRRYPDETRYATLQARLEAVAPADAKKPTSGRGR